MSEVPWDIRRQAALLARRKRARSSKWTRDRPTDWRPQSVINPEDGNPFTPDGAWEFIAERLEDASQSLSRIELKEPPGKKAYVMLVFEGDRPIYVKFQLGAGKIYGRSFHYSTQQ